MVIEKLDDQSEMLLTDLRIVNHDLAAQREEYVALRAYMQHDTKSIVVPNNLINDAIIIYLLSTAIIIPQCYAIG